MMKACNRCGVDRPLASYAPRRALCRLCMNDDARKRMAAHRATPEGRAAQLKAVASWKQRNPEKVAQQRKRVLEARRAANADKARIIAEKAAIREREKAERQARQLQDGHVRAWMRTLTTSERWAMQYRTDPQMQLRERLRTMMRKHAKRYAWVASYFGSYSKAQGRGKLWDAVGYSASELRQHLERQFVAGMSWDRFLAGEIHIDHITPKSTFDLDSLDELRACYALPNLRPMWATENVRKGAKQTALC